MIPIADIDLIARSIGNRTQYPWRFSKLFVPQLRASRKRKSKRLWSIAAEIIGDPQAAWIELAVRSQKSEIRKRRKARPSSLCLDGQAIGQHASGIDTRVEAR